MKTSKIFLSIFLSALLAGCGSTNNNLQVFSSPNHSKSFCLSKYRAHTSQFICSSYWKNTEPACDDSMKEIINERRENLYSPSCQIGSFPATTATTPSSSRSAALPTCQVAVNSMTSKDICQQFYKSTNRACDSEFRNVILRRNEKISPPSECGESNIQKFFIPASDSDRCEKFVQRLSTSSTPLSQACNVRHGIGEDAADSIACRKELNQFINANSAGVGKNAATCGAKLDIGIYSSNRTIKSFYSIAYGGPNEIQDYYKQFSASNKNACKTLAQAKDSDGMFCLYVIERVNKNDTAAYKHLFDAIDRGHPLAQFRFHSIFKNSDKPERRAEANENLINSAVGGFSLAQLNLGWKYMSEIKDYRRAMIWNTKAAEAGDGEAASNVGLLYQNGWGVPRDIKTAVEWHEKAIQLGHSWSGQPEFHLAQIYEKGAKGVDRNLREAIRLYKRIVNDLPRAEKKRKDISSAKLKQLEK